MRVATWLLAPGPRASTAFGSSPGGAGLTSLGATARVAVSPKRVLPTAKAGPSPPSVVDSRLRPTTRTGGILLGGGGGAEGGGAFTGVFAIWGGTRAGFSTGSGSGSFLG